MKNLVILAVVIAVSALSCRKKENALPVAHSAFANITGLREYSGYSHYMSGPSHDSGGKDEAESFEIKIINDTQIALSTNKDQYLTYSKTDALYNAYFFL